MLTRVARIIALVLLIQAPAWANVVNLPTQPTARQSTIRILTLNVMQKALVDGTVVDRAVRFDKIVDYVIKNRVHALALQELSGGTYDVPDTTIDSGADLVAMLGQAGLQYGYYTEASFGHWPEFNFKVGVVPQYKMTFTDSCKLDPPGENWSIWPELTVFTDFPERSNVVVCGMNIPGFGRVNLYSVHVYSDTTVDQKEIQINNLITFINKVEEQHPSRAAIVGGDMNFSVTLETQPIYDIFINNNFRDSFIDVNHNINSGATFGVAGNPYGTSTTPERIDYIFIRGKNIKISNSYLVFNGINGDYLSDHFGVLTEIKALPLPPAILQLILK
jgi:endonuclease/exonuclease/phosphatase family metal-dependent hydrolase